MSSNIGLHDLQVVGQGDDAFGTVEQVGHMRRQDRMDAGGLGHHVRELGGMGAGERHDRRYRKDVSDKMGIEILAVAYLGTRQVNLRKHRNVKVPADLSGIKMRMPGGPEWLLLGRALGVNAVPLGAPEVYLALKTGTIDGQENPLSIFNATKLYEVTEQVVLTAASAATGVHQHRHAGLEQAVG